MSLTGLIKNRDVITGFDKELIDYIETLIPQQKQLVDMEGFQINPDRYKLHISKKYVHMSNYGFIGTCFDILARLELIRYVYQSSISDLITHDNIFDYGARKLINDREFNELCYLKQTKNAEEVARVREAFSYDYQTKFTNIMLVAHNDLSEFVDISDSELRIEDVYNIFPSIYMFAKMEQVYRSRQVFSFKELVDFYNQEFYISDLEFLKEDLAYLYGIFRAKFINSNLVTKYSKIDFNPDFGIASLCVGGADGDIIIDNVLYDFKCVKSENYNKDYWLQLLGYYVLNDSVDKYKIERLGIYRARHGEFELFNGLPELDSNIASKIISMGNYNKGIEDF